MIWFLMAAICLVFAAICELRGYWHLYKARKLQERGIASHKSKYRDAEGSRVQSVIWAAFAAISATAGLIEMMWWPAPIEPTVAVILATAMIVGIVLYKVQCWRNVRAGFPLT